MGSLGWFVCSFRCDPGLHVAVVCQKQKGCLVAIWTTALENCAKRCLLAENLKPREIFHGGILVVNIDHVIFLLVLRYVVHGCFFQRLRIKGNEIFN